MNKINSKSITEAPECAILSAQVLVRVVKNYRTISIINVQPFKPFCICDHRSLSSLVCTPPPPSLEPHLHCMSSNYTYTPFDVAAAHARPFWDHGWNQPTGSASCQALNSHRCSTLLSETVSSCCPSLSIPTCPARPSLSVTSSEEHPQSQQ